MAKLVLSALLRPRHEGVQAQVAEFPDIKVSAWSVGAALARLREALWQRMRWTKVETSCAGEPISPIPQKASSQDLAVPIEVETPAVSPVVSNKEEPRQDAH
jgi:hypothetical protein